MLSFFPLDVLDDTWDLIGSVSAVFPTYSCDVVDAEVACNLLLNAPKSRRLNVSLQNLKQKCLSSHIYNLKNRGSTV